MNFRQWFLIENLKTQYYHYIKANKPNASDIDINNIINQLNLNPIDKQQELQNRYKIKELLGVGKTQVNREDALTRRAKGINKKYWEWIYRLLVSNPSQRFDQSIFDYFTGMGFNPSNIWFNYEEAKRESDKWHQEKYAAQEKKKYKTPITAGERIGDMYMVKLTPEDEEAEGANMGNCIGDQCHVDEYTSVYSLRDKNNNPHVSIRVDGKQISEIKGKENQPPVSKYVPYVVDWLIKHKEFEIDDLDEMILNKEQILKLKNRLRHNMYVDAVLKSGDPELIDQLDFNGLYSMDFHTILNTLSKLGNLKAIKRLISHTPVGGNTLNKYLDIAAQHAAESGHLNAFKYLIQQLDAENGDKNLDMYLPLAAKGGHTNVVKYILYNEQPNNMHSIDNAFYYAVEGKYIDIIRLLINKASSGAIVHEKIEILSDIQYGERNNVNKLINNKIYNLLMDELKARNHETLVKK